MTLNTFPNTPTWVLIEMNIQYGIEYREYPTPGRLAAVIETGKELERRNA